MSPYIEANGSIDNLLFELFRFNKFPQNLSPINFLVSSSNFWEDFSLALSMYFTMILLIRPIRSSFHVDTSEYVAYEIDLNIYMQFYLNLSKHSIGNFARNFASKQ